jgi:hypothetical protein
MNLYERVKNMTPRQIEDEEWKMILHTLELAKSTFFEYGYGNQTWLDGAIGVAYERANGIATERDKRREENNNDQTN